MNSELRHGIRGVGGLLLALALLIAPMASASLAEAGGKPGKRSGKPAHNREQVVRAQESPRTSGKPVRHRDGSKAERVQRAPQPSGKPVLRRPGRVVVTPPPPPVVVRRPPTVVYQPPVVVRRAPVVRVAPWWAVGSPYFWVNTTPYYYNAGLGIYLGGVSLSFQFTNAPPPGYVYFDPYCGYEFVSVPAYRAHLACVGHAHALQVVPVAVCGY